MADKQNNIFPILNRILQREQKEKLLKQKAKVIWFTGLSGAGKTTLGLRVEKALYEKGFLTQVLDGDNIRAGINKNLSFSRQDRLENIRRIAEVNKLLINSGIITINCFVSPTRNIRHLAQEIIGKENFIEIYVNAPLSVCEDRDVKGLYKRARRGEIADFTGISAPFEPPVSPQLEIMTNEMSVDQSVEQILNCILPQVKFKEK